MFVHLHPSAPALARLLLRAQAELSGLLDAMPPASREESNPFLNLHVGGVRLAMGIKPNSNALTLTCSQGDQEYRVELTNEPGKPPALSAQLVNRKTGESRQLNGAAVFRGEVPAEFKGLHAEVKKHLKDWLPESLWDILASAKDTSKPEAPTTEASQPVAANASQATEPSAADETPAPANECFERYVLPQHNGPDLRFTGKLVDAVRTTPRFGRWIELHVYQTKGGKFVGVQVKRSILLREVDLFETRVAASLADLADFFGHTPLAKVLTERLGIQSYNDIE